jgi:hypothetical protein
MSNRRKDEDRDGGEEEIPGVSGGALPPDGGYIPLPLDGEVPYPRYPGAPIVRIDPPVIPD